MCYNLKLVLTDDVINGALEALNIVLLLLSLRNAFGGGLENAWNARLDV